MITQEYLKEIFSYDQHTGDFTRNKSTARKAKKGMIAGYVCPSSGYVKISIKQKNYLAHRLAWMYTYGEWPKEYIDHINRIKTDNRLDNLRECSASQNIYNKTFAKNNKSGIKGVSFCKVSNKWVAQLVINRKHVLTKKFTSKEDAYEAWKLAAKEHHGEFFCE